MKSTQKREIATSFTALLFLVVGVSGIMMFFHIFDKYTKSMHEILGLFFIAAVAAHITYNRHSMRNYLKKKVFLWIVALILVVSGGFIVSSNAKGQNPKKAIIVSVLQAPIKTSTKILGVDEKSAFKRLQNHGIIIDQEESIETIAAKNAISPFAIVSILIHDTQK